MHNQNTQTNDFTRYLGLFWKKKWLILFPAIVFTLVAGYYSMRLPDQFMSTTLILVTPQKVPAKFVAPTVTTGIKDRLHTISQQIFSRTRLEQIIQEFDLFEKERQILAPEEIIDAMRSRIKLKVHRDNAFQLSYVDGNPRLALLVTNKLASLFIEENLKVREQQAIGTTQFLSDEIDRYRLKVREHEKIIYDFKQKHMRELPSQLSSNQARLGQLQNQLQINAQDVNAAQDRVVQLQQQMAEIERRVQASYQERLAEFDTLREQAGAVSDNRARTTTTPQLPIDGEIAKMRKKLARLRSDYTEKHPDVARLTGQLRRLEGEAQQQRDALAARPSSGPGPAAIPDEKVVSEYPPVYDKIKADIRKAQDDINRLTAHNKKIQGDIERYQTRVAAAPARQLQLEQLSEGHDNLKAVLESLINKKLQADLSENLERKQKGEQFKILDPANLPVKPFEPNRLRFVAIGLVVGLALGAGVVLLLDRLNFSVRSREDLSEALDVPVLVVIPEILTSADIHRRWMVRLGAGVAATACLLIALSVVHVQFKSIPQALGDLYAQAKTTHWTTTK